MSEPGHAPIADDGTGPSGFAEVLDAALEDGKAYVHAKQEQLKLDIYGQAGAMAGGAAIGAVAALAITLFLVFVSMAMAVWLGTLLGGMAWGLLAVGGLYLVLFLTVFFLARRRIQEAIQLYVINLLRDGGE